MMRRPRLPRLATILAGAVLLPAALAAQGTPTLRLDSLFSAHRTPLEFGSAAMSGPGWELIVERASRAQFVMVGESHNVREIPLFTGRLFEVLQARSGFAHLALENGPVIMERLGAPGVRGDAAASLALANRYVNALQFRTDQELEMIVAAGRASRAAAPLWGLDQEWGAQHVLERLVELAPDDDARSRAALMLEEAAALEAYRPDDAHPRYISSRLNAAAISALRSVFGRAPAEAHRLLDALETSFEIYDRRTDRPAVYRSNHRREQYMRAQFMDRYRAAVAAGDTLPRVVLKFGQWHALRGVLNWGDVEPLGTFLGELARAHGSESLHIWTGLVNEPGHFWTLLDFPDFVPLAQAGTTDGWWVIDLRAIRPFVAAGQVAGMNDELRKVIYGFDLALLIGSGNQATTERLRNGLAPAPNPGGAALPVH